MSRTDWAALITAPVCEYVAFVELERFGLRPYLPQIRKRWPSPSGRGHTAKLHPLFPRYLLIPIADANSPAIYEARGVLKTKPVLRDENGRPWRCPAKVVEAIREGELKGEFDEVLSKGDIVRVADSFLERVSSIISTMESTGNNLSRVPVVELLVPLLGGARARVSSSRVSRSV